MLPQSSDICLQKLYSDMSTLGVKKCKANQKQHAYASRQVRPKVFILAEAKKLNSLNKRWPSDKANHEKYAINLL